MSRALLVLSDQAEKAKAVAWINGAPVNTRVEFKRPKRSLDQNSKMWAMLTEVAQQVKWHGLTLHADDWKLIFLDALKREVRMVPNIDGNGFVSLGRSSSDLSKDEMSDLIELIFKFGAEHNIQFKESSAHPPADEGSDTAASSPSSVAANPSSAQAETSEAGSDNMGESETEPASADAGEWLKTFAKAIIGAIGPDETVVVNQSKGLFVEGLTDAVRAKARSVTNYARACCRGEIELSDCRETIAGVVGCDEKDLAA